MALQIQAAQRLKAAVEVKAAVGSADMAEDFLTLLGFKGLTFVSQAEDIVRFKYKSYSEAKVNKMLGAPKELAGENTLRYKYGTYGVIVIVPNENRVVLRNSKRNVESEEE